MDTEAAERAARRMQVVAVRLPPAEVELLQEIARAEQTTLSVVLRRAVARLQDQEKGKGR